MKRPVLGRVGAGALILVAAVAMTHAADSLSAKGALRQFDVRSVRSVLARSINISHAAHAPAPAAETPQPEVPLGRSNVHVPILMYHYIRVNPDPRDQMGYNLSVTPADFTSQMDWLAANGYHPVDFDDLRAYFDGRRPLPAKPVVITFDDGYRDLYTTAYPILRAHGFRGVAYIVTGFLGAPNNVTADQVREMDANGIEIGSHTVSHVDLPRTNDAELDRQLRDARASLEAIVRHRVPDFCYPAGRYDGRVVNAVKAAGYDTATTTAPGTDHNPADRWTWTRVRVSGGEPLDKFVRELADPDPTVMPSPRPDAAPRLSHLPGLPVVYPLSAPAVAAPPSEPQPGTWPLRP